MQILEILEKTRHYVFDKGLAQNQWYMVLSVAASIFILLWARKNRTEGRHSPILVWYPLIVTALMLSPLIGVLGMGYGGIYLHPNYYRRLWNLVPMPIILAFAGVIILRMTRDSMKKYMYIIIIFVLVAAGHLIYIPWYSQWDDEKGYQDSWLWELARDERKLPADTTDVADIIEADMKKRGLKKGSVTAPYNIRRSIRKGYRNIDINPKEKDEWYEVKRMSSFRMNFIAKKYHFDYVVCFSGQDNRDQMKKYGFTYLGSTESGNYEIYAFPENEVYHEECPGFQG